MPNLPQPEWPRDYHIAAEVQVPDGVDPLEFCFQKTNNAESPWTKNQEVKVLTDRPRSTSVSDVVVYPNGTVHKY